MKIAINAGHTLTGKGTGAIGLLKEVTENRKIVNLVTSLLIEKGHQVIDCTIDNSTNDLKEAVQIANTHNVDLFCSIHLNAGGGHGTETYILKKGGKAEFFASKINNLVAKSCGFRNRGVKEANFYVLKNTIAPAILIEVCFIDSIEDTSKLNITLVSNAIVQALVEQTTSELFRVRKTWKDSKSQLGAYKILENAKKKASSHKGYHVFNESGKCLF